MREKIGTMLILSLLVLAIASCGCAENTDQQAGPNSSVVLQNSDTVQITDMLGRQLTVPGEISSIVATSPPSTILVYMLAPEKLAGWNFKNNFTQPFMDENYTSLPVIGGWFGTQTGNYETIISMDPDIVIEGYTTDGQINDAIERRQESFGSIPVVGINGSIIHPDRGDIHAPHSCLQRRSASAQETHAPVGPGLQPVVRLERQGGRPVRAHRSPHLGRESAQSRALPEPPAPGHPGHPWPPTSCSWTACARPPPTWTPTWARPSPPSSSRARRAANPWWPISASSSA